MALMLGKIACVVAGLLLAAAFVGVFDHSGQDGSQFGQGRMPSRITSRMEDLAQATAAEAPTAPVVPPSCPALTIAL